MHTCARAFKSKQNNVSATCNARVSGLMSLLPMSLAGMVARQGGAPACFLRAPHYFFKMAACTGAYNVLSFSVLEFVSSVTHAQLRIAKRAFSLATSLVMLQELTSDQSNRGIHLARYHLPPLNKTTLY